MPVELIYAPGCREDPGIQLRDLVEAGGECVARALDARKEDSITAFLGEADARAPLEVCVFNVGANVLFPLNKSGLRSRLSTVIGLDYTF